MGNGRGQFFKAILSLFLLTLPLPLFADETGDEITTEITTELTGEAADRFDAGLGDETIDGNLGEDAGENNGESDSDVVLISNLTEACARAVKNFSAELTAQSVDNLRARARIETKNLLYTLNRYPEKEKAAQWISRLRLEELRQTLSEKEPNMSLIESALLEFQQEEENPELVGVVRVRNILIDYTNAVAREKTQYLHDDFIDACQTLPEDVREYLADPTSVEAPGRIAAALDLIDSAQQNSSSVQDITNLLRNRFTQSNVQFIVGRRVLFPDQPLVISEPTTVQEIVRGTPTYGSGTVEGTLTPAFVANADTAEIRLTFKADIKTNTTAVSSMGVSVLSNGYGKVTIYKPLYFDGKRISLGPASSASNLNATITGINTGRGPIGSQVVYDRVGQEYPYSKAESQRLMETKTVREFEERVKEVTEGNDRLKQVWDLLKTYDYTPTVKTRTTANMLVLSALIGNSRQVGAAGPSSRMLGPHDLVVKIHQSALNNPLHKLFSGRGASEKDVKTWLRDHFPELDIDMLVEKAEETAKQIQSASNQNGVGGDEPNLDDERLRITFWNELPAFVTFTDGILGVHLRVKSFGQKEKEMPGLDIDVEYRLEERENGWFLTLKGHEAWPYDIDRGSTVPARYQVIRRQVKNRLDAGLPTEIPLEAIPLYDIVVTPPPTTGQKAEGNKTSGEPKVRGHLKIGELYFSDGWLVLGADYEPLH